MDETRPEPANTEARPRRLRLARLRLHSTALFLECGILILWAWFVTRPYQSLDPSMVPYGREFLSAIQTHHIWTWAQQCGLCALWNGSERGGAPALADPYGSMMHPLIMLTTLGWGARNGAKIALIAIVLLGGIAQWWLASVLGLSRGVRLWSAMLAMVAGHIGARMENGNLGLVLSTVSCALVLPPLIMLIRHGHGRTAVIVAVLVALALVSGQGYLQIAAAGALPWLLLLLPTDSLARRRALHNVLIAGGLALLLASVFLVPFVHFFPAFVKDTDPEFRSATSPWFMPLHLVINDQDFYTTDALQKLPYPYLYMNFLGWIPIILALWGFFRHRTADRRLVIALAGMTVSTLWLASGQPLAWLARIPPLREAVTGIRFHTVMAGLAIPPLIGLAGMGLQHLIGLGRYRVTFGVARVGQPLRTGTFDIRWLLLVPLVIALWQAYQFNTSFMKLTTLLPETEPVLAALHTPTLQWVNPPFGEHPFVEPAVAEGLKLSSGYRTWNWRDYQAPAPLRNADRAGTPEGMQLERNVEGIHINVAGPDAEYATLTANDGSVTICQARGVAGDIDVRCVAPQAGVLTVKEHSWSGWLVSVNGQAAERLPGQWLGVAVPGGTVEVSLRYRPWDALVGALLSLTGVAGAIVLWRRSPVTLDRA